MCMSNLTLTLRFRWVNGPQPASIADITFFRGGKKGKMDTWNTRSLYFHVPDGVMLVGDSGYEGQSDKVITTKDTHSADGKRLFARMKSMLETCNGRFKNFKIVREAFRHGTDADDKLKKIKMAFEAVAILVQYDCENGHSLFEV